MFHEKDSYVSPIAEMVCIMARQAILEGSFKMRGEDAGDENEAGF